MATSIIITAIICLTIILLVLIFQLTPEKKDTYTNSINLKKIPELKDEIMWDNCELKINPKTHEMKLSYSDDDHTMEVG